MTTSTKDRKPQSNKAYVPTSALAKSVTFTEDMMQVSFTDGRVLGVPLIWFPRLQAATAEQRAHYKISAGGRGLHWPEIDEDVSIAGLMAGVDQQSA